MKSNGNEYDPNLGRWLSRAPSGETLGENLYEYCGNSAPDCIDPTGLCGIAFGSVDRAQFNIGIGDPSILFTSGQFPWWLWIWKIAVGLIVFILLIVEDYYKRGKAALSWWRFVAALLILVIAILCIIKKPPF